MKKNFKCPRCRTLQPMSRKLHGSWTCPKCRTTIIPTKAIVDAGYFPDKGKKDFDNFQE